MTEKTLNSVATHPLQTWAWGEFRKAWGNEVVRFTFGQITIHKLYFLPLKVAIFDKGPNPTKEMLSELKDYAQKNNILFIKLEPNVVYNKKDVVLLRKFGAVSGKSLFTPSTFEIDLTQSEDELLKSFSQKTRYNIRLAEKKGVLIKEDNSDSAFNMYWKLSEQTAKRQGFFVHTKKYHTLMWKTLQKAGIAHLITATYQKEVLATWVVFVWRDTLYYPYGASSDSHKNVMAPNLMMWEAIKFGKSKKLKKFDLWGREEGKGFTKFKEGYNPKIVEFLGTWDLICSPLYWGYRLAEWGRWKVLRLKAKLK